MATKFGSGSLQFELVPDWEKLPPGLSHGDVAAVATDSSGNVYQYCRSEHPVLVYDRDGNFLSSWGEGEFKRPHGIFIDSSDRLYVVDDLDHAVREFQTDGKFIRAIGPRGVKSETGFDGRDFDSVARPGGPYNQPTTVSTGPSSDLYVSDGYGNCQIHRFSDGGDLLQSWGEPGMGPGQFHLPHAVWVHTDGRVFVADRHNERIQIFSADGAFLTEWNDVQRPQYLFIKDDLVFIAEHAFAKGEHSWVRERVAEHVHPRVSIFDLEGNLLVRWGGPDPMREGWFRAPHSLCVDNEGSLYVAETTVTFGRRTGSVPVDGTTFQKFARL